MAQSIDGSNQRLSSFAPSFELVDKCKNRSVWSFLFLAQMAFTAFGLFAIGFDVNFGLNTSNSKFVSFAQSLYVCHSYRELRQKAYDPGVRWKRFLLAVISKFGGGTIISLVLWKRPVLLRSFRHIFTFAVAYFISEQPLYDDFVQTWYLNLVIKLSVAIYRLRKILFIVHVTSNFAELECPIEFMHAVLHYWKGFCVCLVCSVVEFLGGRFFRHWTSGNVKTRNACRWFWTNRGFAVSNLAAILLFYGTVMQSTFDPLVFKVVTLLLFYLQYIGNDLTMQNVLPQIAEKVQKRLSEYDKSSLPNTEDSVPFESEDSLPLQSENFDHPTGEELWDSSKQNIVAQQSKKDQ